MIQLIGLIIATYVFTRMFELALNKDTNKFVGFLSIISIIITSFCTLGLLMTSSQT
jgi:uncharacterized protein YqgC (DUF456 family)